MNRLMKTKWKQLGILALCTVLLFTSACDRTGQKETEQNSEAASQGSSGDQDRAQALADGKYEIEVTLSGGSGRATVDSPCELTVSGGQMTARIEWSSPNYDYMLVDGEKYLPVNTEGNSVFEIPVAVLDEEIPVAADTTAMSKPHEVEYTLMFHSAAEGEAVQSKSSLEENKTEGSDVLLGSPQISSELTYTGSIPLTYAKEFRVDEYAGGYRLLTTRNEKRILLIPEEGKAPDDLPEDVQVLQQPVTDIYIAASAVMDLSLIHI